MENSFITQLLQRDGKADTTTLTYSRDDRIETWVQNYLNADMVSLTTGSDICYFMFIETYRKKLEKTLLLQVFLPINIEKYHWYLAVVNASEGQIHVLDSFGENMTNWKDLDCVVWLND
jgi:hypothetical protein